MTLAVCATLAVLCQEQVGLLIAALAVWLWFRHPTRRRAAVALAAGALAWVVIAFAVILPAFALKGINPHLSRYSSLGDSPGEILLSFVTRPWEVAEIVVTPGRIGYVIGLLVPVLFLALAAPLLALVALPQLVINIFASTGPAQTVDYHYAVLLVPVLVAASLLGLALLRARSLPGRLGRLLADSGEDGGPAGGRHAPDGGVPRASPALGLAPGGWGSSPMHAFTVDAHARALQEAVDLVPEGVPGLGHQRRRLPPVGPPAHPPLPEAEGRAVRALRRRRPLAGDGARPSDASPARHLARLRQLRHEPRVDAALLQGGV